MRTHATAQLIGDRTHQCDATATRTNPDGVTRAYVLFDGIGSNDEVRDWARTGAVRLAQAAARHADAETGLRAVYDQYAAEPARRGPYGPDLPQAAAVVAVINGRNLTVAWCGDSRAYLFTGTTLRRLTQDHNLRRVYPPGTSYPTSPGGNRNLLTSCLGAYETDDEVKAQYGHPAIESTTLALDNGPHRLLLASDGAYEPLEDSCRNLADYLTGTPAHAAHDFVQAAIDHATTRADNATVLIADLP